MDQLANHLAGGDRDDRDTGFPICKDAESFGKKSTKQMMARMSPDAMAFVEDAQPFKEARTQHPEYDALWVLHDLCNIDKHRQLQLTALAFEGASHMGQMNIAGMNFGLLGSESPTVQLAAVKVSSPEEKPPLSFRLEIALTDVLRWQMPVGVSRFLKEVIGLVHDIFKESVARGLLVSTVLA